MGSTPDNFGRPRGEREFATTRWTMVSAVGSTDPQAANTALQQLCQTYWFPLYSFIRSQVKNADEAADITQAFFADLLEREDLKRVDRARGKFRSFLLKSVKHYLLNHWDKQKALKRGGGKSPLSLDFRDADSRYRLEPADDETPERRFQKQWALELIQRVRDRLRREFKQKGKEFQFEKLQPFLAGKNSEETLADAAKQLSMSEVAVKVAVHRMRQQFGQLLRAEIAQTVSSPDEVDTEIQQLFEVLKS